MFVSCILLYFFAALNADNFVPTLLIVSQPLSACTAGRILITSWSTNSNRSWTGTTTTKLLLLPPKVQSCSSPQCIQVVQND